MLILLFINSIDKYYIFETLEQIEAELSCLNGDVIKWEQQIRLRHVTTRQYLCITANDKVVTLTSDSRDPRTVFRLHPVIKVNKFLINYFNP